MRRWLEQLIRDGAYALRSFRRDPGFTAVALLSLMLGIGATTAIFSVIYGVLISPYPYARPGEIWSPQIRSLDGRGGRPYTTSDVREMSQLPVFADVMATSFEPVLMTGDRPPESFGGVLLTGNAFNFLGVPPVIGRTLQPSDVRRDGSTEPVTVLSYRLWQRLFDGRPDAIGRTLRLNDVPHTIVGVMPPRFGWYGNEGLWLPLSLDRKDLPFLAPIVRLAPGVSADTAREALEAFNKQLAAANPSSFPPGGFTTTLSNYLDITVASGEMQTSLRLLLGAVGFLLLIACANVANLQLARGSARSREMAVRLSIGAGRRQLLRQLLTESVALSLVGGAAGVLFAYGAISTIVGMMPEFYVPNESRVTINVQVLLFSLVVAVLTGILFGIVPALQASKADMTEALKAGRSTGSGSQGGRTRSLLVVVEVGLAVVLLVSAGLMMRTFLVLQNTDSGMRSEQVLLMGVPLPPAKYPTLASRNQFGQELLDRVSRLPGVQAATFGVPLGGAESPFAAAGLPPDEQRRMKVFPGGTEHLRTFGIPLLAGRMFDAGEVLRGARVGVLNETAARLWPAGESPIGARLHLGMLEASRGAVLLDATQPAEITIVGIAGDTKNAGLRSKPEPAVMIPYSIVAPPQRLLAVRAAGDPALQLNAIRAELRAMEPTQPLGRPISLEEVLQQEVVQPRFTMALFAAFAALGLLLAAAGIYSVLSFQVARRTHELGVRMALGASRGSVLRLTLATGGRLVLAGLAVGIPASLVATRLLRSQLFGVQASDPAAYAVVAIVLAIVAMAACYVPARRAASVDPMLALRQE
jgi:putative ABC transport system permease protein